jgi:hypothetical protein
MWKIVEADVVRATKFELIDPLGRVRAVLGPTKFGDEDESPCMSTGLAMYDCYGKQRLLVQLDDDFLRWEDGTIRTLSDHFGEPPLSAEDADPALNVAIWNPAGKGARLAITVNRAGMRLRVGDKVVQLPSWEPDQQGQAE